MLQGQKVGLEQENKLLLSNGLVMCDYWDVNTLHKQVCTINECFYSRSW